MMKQTVQLFVKALIIGVLINMGLQQVPHLSTISTESNYKLDQQQPLRNSAQENIADFSE